MTTKQKRTMKRLINMIMLALLSLSAGATGESYFTMGEDDIVRIPRSQLGTVITVPVHAVFGGRVQRWQIEPTYPVGITPVDAFGGPDLTIHYLNSVGEDCSFDALLACNTDFSLLSAAITVPGYFLRYGEYVCYGTAKWPTGYYEEMFSMKFFVDPGFDNGILHFQIMLVGNPDHLGDCVGGGVLALRDISFMVVDDEVAVGDVNGDGKVNISDVTTLINILLTGAEPPAAADVDGDGKVNINDVTALIDRLLSTGN